MNFVREQFLLAAAAQNIKRLVLFLSQAPNPIHPAAAQANRPQTKQELHRPITSGEIISAEGLFQPLVCADYPAKPVLTRLTSIC
jgi:hypothetical protein